MTILGRAGRGLENVGSFDQVKRAGYFVAKSGPNEKEEVAFADNSLASKADVPAKERARCEALVNVLPVLAKANAHKRIEDAEQRQRHLATQLSEKKALRNSLIKTKLRGELKQEEFREMADMIAHDIEGIETVQRAFVAEAEAALQLTTDTSRTTIPGKALWASAHLTDKLTVQNALFPEGILYRTDIRFFEPPDNELQAPVFSMLLSSVGEEEGEEIKSGRGARI